MPGLLFLFALRTPAQKKYFLTTRSGTKAYLQAFPHLAMNFPM
jgi:hypothetical protein